MHAAILVVWWIILLGALFLTVLAVAEIVMVIGHLREIDRLAKRTLPAAQGIVANTATIAALEGVLQTAVRLLSGVQLLDRTAARIDSHVAAVVGKLQGKG